MIDPNYDDSWLFIPPAEVTAPETVQLGSFGVPVNNPGEPKQGLSYWQSRYDQGLPGAYSLSDIFDENGQLKPGWARTANGYERVSAPQSYSGVGGVPTTYGGGGEWGYLTEPYTKTPPSYQPYNWSAAPAITQPPEFSYKEFVAPDQNSMYADPSYLFRKGEGEKALAQRIASTGTYRTGGTLKDFINYNQNAASQEYSNIFNRAVDAHNLGLSQALGTYATNWGVGRDVIDRNMDIWKATNTAGQRQSEMSNQREFDNFLADWDIFEKNRRRAGDYLFEGAGMGG